MNRTRRILAISCLAVATSLSVPPSASASDPPAGSDAGKWRDVKLCLVCHKRTYGMVWGYFDSVSMKSSVIQLKLEDGPLVARFDPDSLKLVRGAHPGDVAKSLAALCAGDDVRVEYSEGKDGLWMVTELAVKPFMEVAPEKRLSVEDVERMVAGKGRCVLIDARPTAKFLEGAIPTAVNVPYPVFQENVSALPKDKGTPIVYYCAGAT